MELFEKFKEKKLDCYTDIKVKVKQETKEEQTVFISHPFFRIADKSNKLYFDND